jgi:acyl carrier protein
MSQVQQQIRDQIRTRLTQIVRRHRDKVDDFDLDSPIFDSQSGLDSLDLAEIFAWMEQAYGVDPLRVREWSVSTWGEFVDKVHAEMSLSRSHS